jgi:hypothetical protein
MVNNELNGFKFNIEKLSLVSFFSSKNFGVTEVVARIKLNKSSSKFNLLVKNIGSRNAYQIEFFTYERSPDREIIVPANFGSEIDYLKPGERATLKSKDLSFEMCGALALQQYWLEYSDAHGGLFRYVIELSPAGKSIVHQPIQIKKRTNIYSRTVRESSLWKKFKIYGIRTTVLMKMRG